jgi:hypothetical protein
LARQRQAGAAATCGRGTGAAAAPPARLLPTRWADDGSEVRAAGAGRTFHTGQPWGLEVAWQTDVPDRQFHVAVGLDRADGVQVCSFATHQDELAPLAGVERRARLLVPSLPLVRGEFALYVFLLDEEGLHVYDQEVVHAAFRVDSSTYRTGLVAVQHRWQRGSSQPEAPAAAADMSSRYTAVAPLPGAWRS